MSGALRAVLRLPAAVIVALAAAFALAPATALAHGPVDPAASHWRARITHVPAGLEAKVVDGDLRLWLRAGPHVTADVIDYRGADYLRFSPGGVYVNTRSAMWFVNQVPTVTPPLDLGPTTPPHWVRVSRGHTYIWQDGRLQALATTVLAPGSSYAGKWSIAVTVDGRAAKITGGLYHRADPSPVWFWPIIVALLCVLAALRMRRPGLDLRIARGLSALALASFAIASAGHQLHGRPVVSAGQLTVLGIELAFVVWAAWWLLAGRHNWLTFFAIAGVAAWQGVALATTLTDGYVLLAVPALLGRLAVIGCLAAAAGLVPVALVMADRSGIGRGRSSSRGEAWQSAA
jgi:hypothetical protein